MSQQYPNTRKATKQSTSGEVDEEIDIDSRILAAIKLAVREEMGEISSRLENIDKTLANLVEVQQRIEVVEESIQYTSDRLDALATEVIPALSNHMSQIAETLAHQTLQIDVHRRKWNIVIHGIEVSSWRRGGDHPGKMYPIRSGGPQGHWYWNLAPGCLSSTQPTGECRHHLAFSWPGSAG